MVGLEHDTAGAVAPPGAPRDLQQQLGHPLGGSEVDAEQPAVGVQNRHQGHVGEVVPLRQHLGTDDGIDLAGVHAIEQRLQRTAAAGRIAVHPGDAQAVDSRLESARDPLGAEPEATHVPGAALGALDDRRALRRAVVATQPFVFAMKHQMRIAPVAIRDPSAGMAHQPWRVAAPVDEQERLLRSRLGLLERIDEHIAQTAVERPRAQVDDIDTRRGCPTGAMRQRETAIAASPHVFDRLQRWGRAAEKDRHRGVPGAHHREIARGVPKPVLLLEGEIVLLVDDEQSGARQGHEHRGARPHNDICGAVAGVRPCRKPLAIGESGMQRLHAARQPCMKAREKLRREPDLGNEHERLTPERDRLLDHLKVDFRLAAAGHAFQHERAELFEARLHRVHRVLLFGVEDRRIDRARPASRIGGGSTQPFESRARSGRRQSRCSAASAASETLSSSSRRPSRRAWTGAPEIPSAKARAPAAVAP